ncbi:MAG: DNA cytosine methyltransferase [Candidatus Gastranaerophilaceae bacterium]
MQNQQRLKFIDFCSGIGGGRLGLEIAGMQCVAHSEINSDADYTYNIFFNDKNNLGDLKLIKMEDIPECDLLIAGFPCQTFSIVGKREGFNDDRGQIIYHLANILQKKNISYFILENVKGLVNHNKGETLKQILKILDNAGYSVFYQILNSENYGVPQYRERVYFVGVRKDLCNSPFIFPKENKMDDIQNYLINYNNVEQDISHPTFQKYINNKYNKDRVDVEDLLKQDYLVIDTRQSDLRVYKGKSPTLRTGRHGILYIKNKKIYKLSGVEALLLQGFSKEMALKVKDIQNNKLLSQAGNAMTVNVIQAIGVKLLEYIKQSEGNNGFSGKRVANC